MKKPTKSRNKRRDKPDDDKDRKALRLAEATEVSPKQAKDLMRKHGKESPKVDKEARNFKAEG